MPTVALWTASRLLPAEIRDRYVAEWTAEALSPDLDTSPTRFSLRILKNAPLATAAFGAEEGTSLNQLGGAVALASLGSCYFFVLCLARGYYSLSVAFALFAGSLMLGGIHVWQGHSDVFSRPRTHVAGALLALANVWLAVEPSKFPLSSPVTVNDDLPLLGVSVCVALVVASHYPPISRPGVARLAMAMLAVCALAVAACDMVNLFTMGDDAVQLGIALTGFGAVSASLLIALGTQRVELFELDRSA